MRKSRLLEEYQVPTEGRDVLHAKMMLPKPPSVPKRLVLMAPLVGAGASQALIIFRNLTRRGSILMSYEYRGHPHSSGTFELDKTVVDTRYALEWACKYARERGLPVHAFATCFGTVPLVAQFAGEARRYPLSSLTAVSALLGLDQILRLEDFAPLLARHLGRRLDKPALLDGIAQGTFGTDDAAFREALQEYLKGVFPELRVGRDYFEELSYDRANIARTLLQFTQARYFDDLAFPPAIPCSFFLGRNDDLLGLHTEKGRRAYRDRVLSLIPHAALYDMEFDHYGRGPDHDAVLDRIGDLFEECEERTVPLGRTLESDPLQTLSV